MREHLVDRALHADRAEGEDAENDEAQVADARIGDEFFQIGLNERHEGAINDANDGEHSDVRRRIFRSVREERQAEAHHAIGAHFEEDTGQNDGTGRGRFDVGIRQPGVQRKERHLDGKGDEERKEKQKFLEGSERNTAGLQGTLNVHQIKAAGEIVQPHDADKHQDGSCHGIENEFDGGVDFAAVAPDANKEGHRDKHHFPEEEEEEEIEREEDANDADFEHQQHDEEFLDALVNVVPGRDDRDGSEERRQDDEEHAEAVHAEVIPNRRGSDPMEILLELIAGDRELHVPRQQQEKREAEFKERNAKGESFDEFVIVAAKNEDRERADNRNEDKAREHAGKHHRETPAAADRPAMARMVGQKAIARIRSAPTTTQTA